MGNRRVRLGFVDVDGFIRDGWVVIRGAMDPATAADCRERIWESMAGRGIPRFAVDGTDPSPVAQAIVAGLGGPAWHGARNAVNR